MLILLDIANIINFSHLRRVIYIFSFLLVIALGTMSAQAQNRRTQRRGTGQTYGMRIEKKVTPPDSAAIARRDSIRKADSLHREDSIALLGKSSLDMPLFSAARDTVYEEFENGRKIYYYGDVSVTYQDMRLTAEYMEYDMKTGTVFARGAYDSTAGEWVGRPVMTQGDKTYNMEEVRYNFNSRKARITNMITTEDDGQLHGQNIKMMDDGSINLTDGKYTVCDAEHPHYYLHLSSAKVVKNPSQKTIFGPAYMVVEDVKLPFIGLPFGFIPKRPERATGMLMPTFGEEEARGFYMRDAGMYFVFGDYLDLSVTGDYYTLGSWAVDINSRYKVNYKFNGNFSLTYSNDQTGEKGTKEFFQTRNFAVKWSHSQDSKAHPGSTFSASVNFQSPSNNRYNATSITEAQQNQISSSISYSKNWNGKFNLSVNALHNQNTKDSSYVFTLPNITFSMTTIYPFKIKNRVGKEKFYEKISFGYNTTLQNKISFKASDFNSGNMLEKFQNGMAHNFSIGLPNFQLFKYISIAPGVSYSQNWFFRKNEYAYNPETDAVEAQDSQLFNGFGITQNYSFSTSASTRIYGTFNFGKQHKIQAIRHVISPSLSLSLSPDKATYANGYRTLIYTDANGVEQQYDYNIYSGTGQLYSPPSAGKSASLSLSIGNNIEAKVRDYADTTGSGTKKVKLIDQLNISTGYNFLAEQFKMQTVSLNMSTSLFNKISLSASAGLDPYAVDSKGTRINEFAIANGQGPLRLTNLSASASYSLSGKGTINGNDGSKSSAGGAASYYQRNYYHPVTGEYIPGGWLYYTNPNVPWSFNLSSSFVLTKSYSYDSELEKLQKVNRITATLSASGNIKLTPKLSINMTSGFDFVALKPTTTQISAQYDLHCFNIDVSWIPLGTWKSYSFRIAANAAALADLLRFRKSDSFWDN